MTISQELRQRLKHELIRTGWSQARLSKKSGVSREGVNHLLTGYRDGRIATWQRLFDALSEISDYDPKTPLR